MKGRALRARVRAAFLDQDRCFLPKKVIVNWWAYLTNIPASFTLQGPPKLGLWPFFISTSVAFAHFFCGRLSCEILLDTPAEHVGKCLPAVAMLAGPSQRPPMVGRAATVVVAPCAWVSWCWRSDVAACVTAGGGVSRCIDIPFLFEIHM